MKVVCAFAASPERGTTGLRKLTFLGLSHLCPWPVEYRDCTGDDEGYWRFLAETWEEAVDDVLVVEHDIVPRHAAFDALLRCPEPWCGYRYELACGVQAALGFTRFRLSVIEENPDLIVAAGAIDDDGMPARHWVRLDTRIDRTMRARGYELHEHGPPLDHLNERQREVRYDG